MELWFESISQLIYGASIIALLFWLSQRTPHGFLRCFSWLCWIEAAWVLTLALQREEWRLLWLSGGAAFKGAALLYATRRWPLYEAEPASAKSTTSTITFVGLALASLFLGRIIGPLYRISGDALSITMLFCLSALASVIIQRTARLQLLSLAVLQGGLFLLAVHLNPQLPLAWVFGSLAALLLLVVRHSLAGKEAAVAEA